MISMIVAMDKKNNIGLKGKMPWGHEMKADLKRFQDLTRDKFIIMGRKTYESLPFVLPGRRHVVITSDASKRTISKHPVFYVQNIAEAWDFTKYEHRPIPEGFEGAGQEGEVFVIGGAQVYEQFMQDPDVRRLYVTIIHGDFEGDTVFPEITDEWEPVKHTLHPADNENPYPWEFITYER